MFDVWISKDAKPYVTTETGGAGFCFSVSNLSTGKNRVIKFRVRNMPKQMNHDKLFQNGHKPVLQKLWFESDLNEKG